MSSSKEKNCRKSLYQTTKVISFLLSDTTLTHRVQQKEKSEKIKSSLNEKEKRLESQSLITKKIRKQVRLKDRWQKIVEKQLELYELKKVQETSAAVTIQRILKGCLVRSKYTDTILKIKEFKTSLEIHTLRGQTDMCMLTLGINTVPVTPT
jgi:predicted methyltransferase